MLGKMDIVIFDKLQLYWRLLLVPFNNGKSYHQEYSSSDRQPFYIAFMEPVFTGFVFFDIFQNIIKYPFPIKRTAHALKNLGLFLFELFNYRIYMILVTLADHVQQFSKLVFTDCVIEIF